MPVKAFSHCVLSNKRLIAIFFSSRTVTRWTRTAKYFPLSAHTLLPDIMLWSLLVFHKELLIARQDRAVWNGVVRTFIILLFLAAVWFSIFINYTRCFELWCRKFLPEFSLLSVALLCPLLTLFKGCTCSLLVFGRTRWNSSRLWNASLLISGEFNQQKASLNPMWSLHVLISLP